MWSEANMLILSHLCRSQTVHASFERSLRNWPVWHTWNYQDMRILVQFILSFLVKVFHDSKFIHFFLKVSTQVVLGQQWCWRLELDFEAMVPFLTKADVNICLVLYNNHYNMRWSSTRIQRWPRRFIFSKKINYTNFQSLWLSADHEKIICLLQWLFFHIFSIWKLSDICQKPSLGTIGNGNNFLERVISRIFCDFISFIYEHQTILFILLLTSHDIWITQCFSGGKIC